MGWLRLRPPPAKGYNRIVKSRGGAHRQKPRREKICYKWMHAHVVMDAPKLIVERDGRKAQTPADGPSRNGKKAHSLFESHGQLLIVHPPCPLAHLLGRLWKLRAQHSISRQCGANRSKVCARGNEAGRSNMKDTPQNACAHTRKCNDLCGNARRQAKRCR